MAEPGWLVELLISIALNVASGVTGEAALRAARRIKAQRVPLAQQLVEESLRAFSESVRDILEGWRQERGGVFAQSDSLAVERALGAVKELSLAPREAVEKLAEIIHQQESDETELTEVVLGLLRPYWAGGLPAGLERAVRERWLDHFHERLRERIARNQELTNYALLEELSEVKELLKEPWPERREPPERLINLPDLSQRIYGRDREAKLVLDALQADKRAVAIVAPPLFGKTALLVRVLQLVTDGRELKERGLHGIAVLNCRDVTRDLAAMARELGRLSGQSQEWEEVVRREGAPREKACELWSRLDRLGPTWIVLENFEELLAGPEKPEPRDEQVRAFLEVFFERQSPHKLLVLSRYMPRLPRLHPFGAVEEGLRRGLQLEQALALLREEGRDCGFATAPERVLHDLACRLHFMPFGLRLAVEYVRYSRGERGPEALLDEHEFQAFREDELEQRFDGILRSLLHRLSPEAQRVVRWLAFLPAPLPRSALEALAEGRWLTDTLVTLRNSVLIEAECDRANESWYRLHAKVREVVQDGGGPWWEEIGYEAARRLFAAGNAAYRQRRYAVAEAVLRATEAVLAGLVDAGREDLKENVATAAMNRAVTLDALKRYEEALAGYDEALRIRRELVAAGREDLKENVATAAMNRAVTLRALKRYEEALAGYDEALRIWRELVAAGREDLKEDVATAAMNRAVTLDALKRYEEALAGYDEALRIWRELVAAGREDLKEDVATAAMNRALTLDALKRYEEALAGYDEALGIRRELVAAGREDLKEDVATAAMNRALTLDALKRYEEALAGYDEALGIWRELVAAGREDLKEDVATAAMNRAVTLDALKRYEEALAGYDEALRIRRELVAAGREDLKEDVATAAMNRAVTLDALKRYEEALAGYDEALRIRRELVAAGREDLKEDVATAAMNRAVTLGALKRYKEALAGYDEALRIRRELVAAGREDLKENVATAAMNRAVTLGALKRYEEALAGYDEALGIWRELVAAGREDLKQDVATAAMNRAVTLDALKRYEEALAGYDEALGIRRELVAAGREELREELATGLANKHLLLEAMGHLSEALQAIEEAIQIRKQLVCEGYEHVREDLLEALEWKAMTFEELGRPDDAARCRREADEWRRK
jgi:tetratricopeptide (TPR) repeat protein